MLPITPASPSLYHIYSFEVNYYESCEFRSTKEKSSKKKEHLNVLFTKKGKERLLTTHFQQPSSILSFKFYVYSILVNSK